MLADASWRIPERTLTWPVYVSDDGRLTCNQTDCPEPEFLQRLSRRNTVQDVLQAIHEHAVTVPHVRDSNQCVNATLPECRHLPHPHPVGTDNAT
jgi:hypothetical protein